MIYISPVHWSSVAQRPHFFVREALRNGFSNIIWINPTPSRFPELGDIKRVIKPFEADSIELPTGLTIVNAKLIPLEPLGSICDLLNRRQFRYLIEEIKSSIALDEAHLVIGKPSRFSLSLLNNYKFKSTTFDLMDNFPSFFEGIAQKSVHKLTSEIIYRCELVMYSCSKLFSRFSLKEDSSMLILNAYSDLLMNDDRDFSYESKNNNNKIVFGYIGTIAKWFDWDVIVTLATKYENCIVRIIGPNYSRNIPELPSNVEILPAIQHSEVRRAISKFDYGLIPFKVNELTDYVDPVKYYEYTALEIPVISTDFGQMSDRITAGMVQSFDNFSKEKIVKKEAVVSWSDRFNSYFERVNIRQ